MSSKRQSLSSRYVLWIQALGTTDKQDIFRRYPHNYEGIIPTLCANLEELDEPEAKASLIWIIGEYAEKIDNADELLGTFLEAFKEESYPVSCTSTLENPADFFRSSFKH